MTLTGAWLNCHTCNRSPMKPFAWSTLREFSHNKAVMVSGIALVLVPSLARLSVALHCHLQLAIDIPINLTLLFIAGICFFPATVILAVFCPKLTQELPNYGALATGKHSEVDLRNWFHDVILDKAKNPDPKKVLHYLSIIRGADNVTTAQAAELLEGKAGHAIMDPFWITPAGDRLPLVYDFASKTADQIRSGWRWTASFLFAAGCLCLIAVEGWRS